MLNSCFVCLKTQNQMVKKVMRHAELWGKILKCQSFMRMCVVSIQIHEVYVAYITYADEMWISMSRNNCRHRYGWMNEYPPIIEICKAILGILLLQGAYSGMSPGIWQSWNPLQLYEKGNFYCANNFYWVSGVLLDTFSILFVKYDWSIPVKKYSIKYKINNIIHFQQDR